MSGAVLVINAGSSSIKFALYGVGEAGVDPDLVLRGQVEGIGTQPNFLARDASGKELSVASVKARVAPAHDHEEALTLVLDWLAADFASHRLMAVGHRVVHGGTGHARPLRLDDDAVAALRALIPLAPHHQPHNVAAIDAIARRRPGLPQVACFDTSFHTTQPYEAVRLPLPAEYWQRGIRRYGFHGLSYEYIVACLPRYMAVQGLGDTLPERVIVAHLGNGASLCAIRDGRSIATTMGFSTLDGVPMGTRSGAIDPGVLLHLMAEDGLGHDGLTDLLYNRSGLFGLSGVSGDMRALLASSEAEARRAVAVYCYRIARELGSLAAALEGLDAIVFTAGVGEHAAPVRADVCRRAGWLGVKLDDAANRAGGPLISGPGSAVAAWTIPTNEELMIARHTLDVMAGEIHRMGGGKNT